MFEEGNCGSGCSKMMNQSSVDCDDCKQLYLYNNIYLYVLLVYSSFMSLSL